jgi:hypothetical protein
MRKRIVSIAAAIFFFGACAAIGALETGFVFRSSNLQFPWGDTEPIQASVTSFPADNFFWGGEAWISEALGEEADIRVSYERDPVLRNSVVAAVEFERGIARISVGPRIGLFNSDETPLSAGLSTAIRLQWPGVAYLSMRSDGGLSVGVLQSGADPQARTELAAGLYLHNVILSAVVSAKRFNELDASGDPLVTDSWTRYALEADIFKKNVPYTLLCSMGYELRSKRFVASDKTDSLGAVVLGTTGTAKLSRSITLIAELSSGFYTFGLDELAGRSPSASSFMFSAGLGMSLDIDSLLASAAAKAANMQTAEAPAATPTAADTTPTEPKVEASDEAANPATP